MTELSEQDIRSIKDLHDIWIAKEVKGNGSEVVDLCTDDVQWLPPDAPPIVGKEKIAEYLASHHVKILAVDTKELSIRGGDSLAYLTSNYITRYLPESHSAVEHEASGTHLWVVRKEGENWRVAVVTWSSW